MTATQFATREPGALCTNCNIPLDARHFDESLGPQDVPAAGRELVLASFELPPQYCGILEYFSQFADSFAKDNSHIQTTKLRWLILANDRPLHPYLDVQWILNPWGYGSFPFCVRLDEGMKLQFVVRCLDSSTDVKTVAGRIAGRYWYNPAYGDVARRGY
jgi:hypothetical protein